MDNKRISSGVSGSGSSGSSALGENLEYGEKEEGFESVDLSLDFNFAAALLLAEDGVREGVRDREAVE